MVLAVVLAVLAGLLLFSHPLCHRRPRLWSVPFWMRSQVAWLERVEHLHHSIRLQILQHGEGHLAGLGTVDQDGHFGVGFAGRLDSPLADELTGAIAGLEDDRATGPTRIAAQLACATSISSALAPIQKMRLIIDHLRFSVLVSSPSASGSPRW